MTFKDLKEFIGKIPDNFDDYEIVNGEVGYIHVDDDTLSYRVDKPIIAMYVDEQTQEICFFHQTRQDVDKFYSQNDDLT